MRTRFRPASALPGSRRGYRRWLGLALLCAAVVVSVVAVLALRAPDPPQTTLQPLASAAAQLATAAATPPRAALPATGSAMLDLPPPVATAAVVPPGSHPAWLAPIPDFAGSVLYWTSQWERQWRDAAGTLQSESGNGAFWVAVADDGSIARLHEVFTGPDGTVVQTTAYDATICPAQGFPSVPSGPQPEFLADADILQRLGFRMTPDEAAGLATDDPLPGVTPTVVFLIPYPAPVWGMVDTDSTPGLTITRTVAADGASRIIFASASTTDAQGQLIEANAVTFGSLYVYAPGDVPDTVFSTDCT